MGAGVLGPSRRPKLAPPGSLVRVPPARARDNCNAAPRRARVRIAALRIDHRFHLELSYERQAQDEELLARAQADVSGERVVTVAHLRHLEALLDAAGGCIAVLLLHSRSCGICKDVQGELARLAKDSHSQRAGIVFLEHDVVDEFDFASELARFYRVRSVPAVLFFVDGAVVCGARMPADVLQAGGNRAQVQYYLHAQRLQIQEQLRALLFKNAPSARR